MGKITQKVGLFSAVLFWVGLVLDWAQATGQIYLSGEDKLALPKAGPNGPSDHSQREKQLQLKPCSQCESKLRST